MDLAPHGLDLVDFLLGEPLVQIAAMTQARAQDYAVDDGALLIGRTEGGALAQLNVAITAPTPCRAAASKWSAQAAC